ncbi:MAG: N-acetylneuraminate synthase family protein [Gammaproteobacteria bacterium]|nr:N-acetylneuraminate synthase family protein [Gammaproteobacteria bacterium]
MSVFVIAEIGPNHNGDIALAKQMIKELSKTGADAVKFQISKPENLHSKDSFKARYWNDGVDLGDPLEMSRKLNFSQNQHIELANYCDECGIEYMCTAFDLESLKFLDKVVNIKRFKIPSGDLLTPDILEYVSKQNKPIIMSTGMATYRDIEAAIDFVNSRFKGGLTVLHCVSSYPAPIDSVNLLCMDEIKQRFGVHVGYSDHTLGKSVALAAVALGAEVIEKHVTTDRNLPGPDHKASALIPEFKTLVEDIRNVSLCLGGRQKVFTDEELDVASVAKKSVVTRRDLKAGANISEDDICFKRPGTGIPAFSFRSVIGRKLIRDLQEGKLIRLDDLDD